MVYLVMLMWKMTRDVPDFLNESSEKCLGLPGWLSGYRICLRCRRPRRWGLSPWVRKIPWRRKWKPTPVFWPGEFHGLQSLRCCKESDVTERLSLSLSTQTTAALNRKNNPPLDLIKNPKTSINRRINKECACVCVFSKSRPTLCDPECACVCVFSKSCLTLCDPMDRSPPGSSVSESSQARILEWVSISSSKRSSWPRDQTHVSCISCIGKWILYHWVTWEVQRWRNEIVQRCGWT